MYSTRVIALVAATSTVLAGCAAPTYQLKPVTIPGQEIRYVQGQATTYQNGSQGSIQVTPQGVTNGGRLSFGVAAYNAGKEAENFGIENLSLWVNGAPVHVFTYPEMERQAKNAANAAMIASILVGAVAVAAAANAQSTSTYQTPRGTYRYTYQNSATQGLLAGVAAAGTVATVKSIGDGLDATLTNMSGTILQTTTIDPEEYYGGRAESDRVALPESGATLDAMLKVRFNDEDYEFHWDLTQLK